MVENKKGSNIGQARRAVEGLGDSAYRGYISWIGNPYNEETSSAENPV